ncbi:MAG: hypothetical protein ACKOZT_06755 [Cyanobium sp.]
MPQTPGSLPVATEQSNGGSGRPQAEITISSLQGWHLPLLDDPAFLPLQPLLQRQLLLALPRRVASALGRRPAQALQVLVASRHDARGRSHAVGLLLARAHNRSGSCMELQQLVLASALERHADLSGRTVAASLLREAIERSRNAASWIASVSSLETARLAVLRELGFQPQRTDRLHRWQATTDASPATPLPANLQLRPLQSRTAPLLWHLEQTTCQAPLRQLLDRRVEDLLDRSESRGWLLIDGERNEAVAAVRWVADHPAGGERVELSVHPGWSRLYGAPTEHLLRSLTTGDRPLWISAEVGDTARNGWLLEIGAEEQGEEVLMARTVWRRQEGAVALRPAQRLGAVLERLQPGRRPVPTPLAPR